MKKIIATAALTAALVLGAAGPAQALSIDMHKDGRVKTSASVREKLKTPAQKKIINTRAKKFGTPRAFERDIRGCELQYKVRTDQQSDCINMTIRYHGQYS